MPSSAVPSESVAFILVFFASLSAANAPDDFRPTPEERLADAGIEVSIPSLTTTLQDLSASPDLRSLSAVALGRTRNIAVLETLHSALTDATEDVRAGAATGLRYLAASASAAPLRELALTDPSDFVRQSTIVALQHIGGDLAASTLIDIAAASSNSETLRANALLALGRVARPAQRDALLALLMDALHDPATPKWLREQLVVELEKLTH